MKVVIVNVHDIVGGAARAAHRLHESLTMYTDIDSTMFVQVKDSNDPSIIGPNNKFRKLINLVKPNIEQLLLRQYHQRKLSPFSLGKYNFGSVIDHINELEPDIVHLHWICRSMISIKELSKIRAPIVWSLHDMWPFTGGCHYDDFCGKFKTGCGACPQLGSSSTSDATKKVILAKDKAFGSIDSLTIVGLSNWLANEAKSSTLFKDKCVVNLPNPIDIKVFKPADVNVCRELWNLPLDKKIVLFGAMSATSDTRKGFKYLEEAMQNLDDEGYYYVVFGSPVNKVTESVRYIGSLTDDISLASLYSSADVVVLPSVQENLSNMVLESIACGTPVVAFDIGGNSDLINNRENGYLAKAYNSNDLASGISWCLEQKEIDLRTNARAKALEFSYESVSESYYKLYTSIMDKVND